MPDNLGEALLLVAVKGLASTVPGGALVTMAFDQLAGPVCKSAWAWLKGRPDTEQQRAITDLAKLSTDRARSLVAAELDKTPLSDAVKAELTAYLSVVPNITRQRLMRAEDLLGQTTLLSQLPRSEAAVARFLPLRPPRFSAGYKIPHYDYKLERLLGQGGFGEVWEAHNVATGQGAPVAIKFCLDPQLEPSLGHEVAVLNALRGGEPSRYIVDLRLTALTSQPPFLVYEFADAGDLTHWLSGFDGKQVPSADVVRVLKMVSRGLAHAHGHGVVHHDLKPSNLLVSSDGRVMIADFGIGKIVSRTLETTTSSNAALYQNATLMNGAGTPLYTDREATGTRRDIYALGVIAYQLLVGDVTTPVPPSWRTRLTRRQVEPRLIELVSRCLDTTDDEIADGAALAAALETLESHARPQPTAAVDSLGPVTVAQRSSRRAPVALAIAGVVCALAVAFAGTRTQQPAGSGPAATSLSSASAAVSPSSPPSPATPSKPSANPGPARETPIPEPASRPNPSPAPVPELIGRLDAQLAAPARGEATGLTALEQFYVGKHRLGVNRVSDDRRTGSVTITKSATGLQLTGSITRGQYHLTITGTVEPVSERKFFLTGAISGIPDMAWHNEPPTSRHVRARFMFEATQGRRYWRMYEVNGVECVCGVEECNQFCYIDIEFKPDAPTTLRQVHAG